MSSENTTEPFLPPAPGEARAEREYAGLHRIATRHAATDEQRRRTAHPATLLPYEAVLLVTSLAGGALLPETGEESADEQDIAAALTLMPRLRADVDALEESLLLVARGRGLTWQQIAFALGLGSAQAARQRYERLTGRAAARAQAE